MQVDLTDIAKSLRRRIVQMHHQARVGHLGSSLSCADILTALYWGSVLRIDPQRPEDPDRDRFVLSKGHAASALYAALAYRGFFPQELLYTYAQDGSVLAEHPPAKGLLGVEAATGSLGHGLPIAVGMALAGRMQGRDYRTFCLLSDGDCQEGSTWEAAAFAYQERLGRLCVIVDANGLQGIRNAPDDADALAAKFEAFGWPAERVNGHDLVDLVACLRTPGIYKHPMAVIARTTKGRGVSFLEDTIVSHYKVLDDRELGLAIAELQ